VTTTVTTTVRVIDGIHYHAAYTRAFAQMAVATSFADFDVLVLLVAHDANASRAG
jgi:hypothetical protein